MEGIVLDLFICSSAYQLLNAISIVKNEKIEADVLFLKGNMNEVCNFNLMKELKFFNAVYSTNILNEVDEIYESKNNIVTLTIKKFIYYLNINKICNKLPNNNQIYSKVYISYADVPHQSIYFFFKKKGAILSMYEDGIYTYEFLSIKESITKKILCMFLFRSYYLNECKEIWVRRIDKININQDSNIIIRKIENNLFEFKSDLVKVFNYDINDLEKISNRLIVFDQSNIEVNDIVKKQIEIVDIISKVIGSDQLVIKLHPSTNKILYSDTYNLITSKVPFEILMCMCSMSNKVLISIFSTACFSPKLLLGEEPYIILTYKILGLFDIHFLNDGYLNFIKKMKCEYSDPNKIKEPDTIEELIDIVRDILVQED